MQQSWCFWDLCVEKTKSEPFLLQSWTLQCWEPLLALRSGNFSPNSASLADASLLTSNHPFLVRTKTQLVFPKFFFFSSNHQINFPAWDTVWAASELFCIHSHSSGPQTASRALTAFQGCHFTSLLSPVPLGSFSVSQCTHKCIFAGNSRCHHNMRVYPLTHSMGVLMMKSMWISAVKNGWYPEKIDALYKVFKANQEIKKRCKISSLWSAFYSNRIDGTRIEQTFFMWWLGK